MAEATENLTRKALAATKFTFIFRTLSQLLGAASLIILVRLLSEHDYGIYNLLYSVIALLGMVASLGIANTIQRYMPEYLSRGEFVLAARLYRYASFLRLLSNVAVLSLVFLFWDYLGPLLKIAEYKKYFLFFSLIIFLHMQRGVLETYLNSYFLQKYTQGLSIIFVVVKGFGYGLALFLHWNLWFVLVVDFAAYLLVFFFLQIVYTRKIPRQGGQHQVFPPEEQRRLRRYALFYNFNDAGAGALDANFDNFFIVMFLDPVAVGAYAFCNRLVRLAGRLLPTNYLIDVIRPLFFVGTNDTHSEDIKRNFQLLTKTVYIFYLPLFAIFLLLSREIIVVLFGGKFIEYYPIVTAVAFFNLINGIQMPVGLVAQLKERADVILYSKIFAIYNLLADVVLIQFHGIWGAVLATGTAVLGKNLFIWFFVRKEASFVGMGKFFIRLIGGWLVVAGIWFVSGRFVGNEVLRLGAGLVLLAISFFFLLRTTHFNEWERGILSGMSATHKKVRVLMKLSGLSISVMGSKNGGGI